MKAQDSLQPPEEFSHRVPSMLPSKGLHTSLTFNSPASLRSPALPSLCGTVCGHSHPAGEGTEVPRESARLLPPGTAGAWGSRGHPSTQTSGTASGQGCDQAGTHAFDFRQLS